MTSRKASGGGCGGYRCPFVVVFLAVVMVVVLLAVVLIVAAEGGRDGEVVFVARSRFRCCRRLPRLLLYPFRLLPSCPPRIPLSPFHSIGVPLNISPLTFESPSFPPCGFLHHLCSSLSILLSLRLEAEDPTCFYCQKAAGKNAKDELMHCADFDCHRRVHMRCCTPVLEEVRWCCLCCLYCRKRR